jgi:hypothetical protein
VGSSLIFFTLAVLQRNDRWCAMHFDLDFNSATVSDFSNLLAGKRFQCNLHVAQYLQDCR